MGTPLTVEQICDLVNCNPQCSPENSVFKTYVLQLLCAIAAGGGGQGGCCGSISATATLTSSTEVGAGSVLAGQASVSILNVGNAAGVVDGELFLPGELFEFAAFVDPTTNQFRRSPVITFDATGTEFRVRFTS